eukprot:TRINITY_DN1927_c0_g1_i1.p1 TRINITY_DN1927_c0_g1~~TRINITY_DN1927_c0_g1_i1.p1  ORF type:complete len:801 (+),score=222.23 TRINITY_DN1927_c0_g1_i1:87-2489(+)
MHSDTFVIFALLVILGFLLLPPIVTRPPLSESSFVTHQPGEEEVENDSSASPFASFSNDTELVQFISPFLDETSKPSSERVVEYDEFERTIRCQRENESSFERRLIRMEGEYIYVGCPVQHKLSISRLRDYNDSSLEGTVVHRRSFQGGVPIALFLYDGILVVFLRDERIAKTVNLHTFHRTHTTTIITRVVFMDVRDPAHPRDLKSFSVNGEYVEARLVDSYMYFVVAHRNCVHRVFDSPYGVDVDFPEIVEERRTWRPRMFHFRQPSHMFEFHSIVSVDLNENGNNGGGFDGGESHVNDRSEVDEKINKRDEQKGSDSKSKESSSGATSMGKKLSISSSSIHAQSFLLGYGSELYMSRNNLFISHPIHRSYGQEKEESERVFVSAVLPLLPADIRSSLWESRSGDRHQFDWMKVRAIMRDMYNDMDDEEARSLESKIAHHVEEFYRKLRLQNDRTWIHKFSCNRGIVRYSCGTTVPGHIRNSFSMDEYDGYLRVATMLHYRFSSSDLSSNFDHSLLEADENDSDVIPPHSVIFEEGTGTLFSCCDSFYVSILRVDTLQSCDRILVGTFDSARIKSLEFFMNSTLILSATDDEDMDGQVEAGSKVILLRWGALSGTIGTNSFDLGHYSLPLYSYGKDRLLLMSRSLVELGSGEIHPFGLRMTLISMGTGVEENGEQIYRSLSDSFKFNSPIFDDPSFLLTFADLGMIVLPVSQSLVDPVLIKIVDLHDPTQTIEEARKVDVCGFMYDDDFVDGMDAEKCELLRMEKIDEQSFAFSTRKRTIVCSLSRNEDFRLSYQVKM